MKKKKELPQKAKLVIAILATPYVMFAGGLHVAKTFVSTVIKEYKENRL